MDRVAIGLDRRAANRSVVVRKILRLDDCGRSALHGFFECVIRILDLKRDVSHAVTVLLDMFGGGWSGCIGVVNTKLTLFCFIR
jgi:hypothetical protein